MLVLLLSRVDAALMTMRYLCRLIDIESKAAVSPGA